MKRVLAACLAALAVAACSDRAQNERIQFAAEALEDNMLTTHRTALVEITGADVLQPPQEGDAPDEDLIVVRYTARVLRDFAGDGPQVIEFVEYVDPAEGVEDVSKGKRIVSLCERRGGGYYLPDIGFEMLASEPLTDRAAAMPATDPAGSACDSAY